jgi:hypothetical protein
LMPPGAGTDNGGATHVSGMESGRAD